MSNLSCRPVLLKTNSAGVKISIYAFILLILPLLTGSSYVVKDGNKEIGRMETHDGSSEKEVVSKQELKQDAGGYSHPELSEIKGANSSGVKIAPNNSIEAAPQAVRGDYGIVKGIPELEVDRIASRENMGFPNKTTEYAPGDTYPVSTWVYEYETGGLKHFFKVYFDSDGKVIRANHQTKNK